MPKRTRPARRIPWRVRGTVSTSHRHNRRALSSQLPFEHATRSEAVGNRVRSRFWRSPQPPAPANSANLHDGGAPFPARAADPPCPTAWSPSFSAAPAHPRRRRPSLYRRIRAAPEAGWLVPEIVPSPSRHRRVPSGRGPVRRMALPISGAATHRPHKPGSFMSLVHEALYPSPTRKSRCLRRSRAVRCRACSGPPVRPFSVAPGGRRPRFRTKISWMTPRPSERVRPAGECRTVRPVGPGPALSPARSASEQFRKRSLRSCGLRRARPCWSPLPSGATGIVAVHLRAECAKAPPAWTSPIYNRLRERLFAPLTTQHVRPDGPPAPSPRPYISVSGGGSCIAPAALHNQKKFAKSRSC